LRFPDVEKFYQQCDPERDNLCLYGERSGDGHLFVTAASNMYPSSGEPNGTWLVDLPAEEVPPELPEPCLGINFARDGMYKREWLALVAVHSDSWLLAVAFFYAVRLDNAGRCALNL
jgi:Alfin